MASANGDSPVLYLCGSTGDVDQLAKYLSNATATAPFNVYVVVTRLLRALAHGRGQNASTDALRIPLSTMHAAQFKVWLEQDALRLASCLTTTMFQTLSGRPPPFVDKILRGANASEIPVQQAATLRFVINLKTAKALGLTIPPSLLQSPSPFKMAWALGLTIPVLARDSDAIAVRGGATCYFRSSADR